MLSANKLYALILLSVCDICFAKPDVMFNRTLQDTRNAQVVFQQKDLSCGAASLSMLFRNFLGEGDSEEDVFNFVAANRGQEFESVNFEDMRMYAQHRGFDGLAQYLSYRDMVKLTRDRKVPFIVRIKTRDTSNGVPQDQAKNFYHFVVVRGASQDLLRVSDPKIGNVQYSQDEFLDLLDFNSEGKGEVFFIVPKRDSGRRVNRNYIDDPRYYDFDRGAPSYLRY